MFEVNKGFVTDMKMDWTTILLWAHVNFAVFYFVAYQRCASVINLDSNHAKGILLISLGLGIFAGVLMAYAAK